MCLGFRKADGFSGTGCGSQIPGAGHVPPFLAMADHSHHPRKGQENWREEGSWAVSVHASSLCLLV